MQIIISHNRTSNGKIMKIRIFAALLAGLVLLSNPAAAAWRGDANGPYPDPYTACDSLTLQLGTFNGMMLPRSNNGRLTGYLCYFTIYQPAPISLECANDLQEDAASFGGCIPEAPPKIAGQQCGQVGNPVTVSTGNKYDHVVDYTTGGIEPLSFERYYNSIKGYDRNTSTTADRFDLMGANWRTNWDRELYKFGNTIMYARRADGSEVKFSKSGGTWNLSSNNHDVPLRLAENGSNYEIRDTSDTVETYDGTGKLITVKTRSGYTQTLAYGANNRLTQVTDTQGRSLAFNYVVYTQGNGDISEMMVDTMTTTDGRIYKYNYSHREIPIPPNMPHITTASYAPYTLSQVIYPDNTPLDPNDNPKLTYHYEDANYPQFLTGITDEKNNRLATYTYNSEGRATQSTHAGGAENTTIAYTNATTRTVTNALGKQTIYRYSTVEGAPKITQVEGIANGTCEAANQNYTYDGNGYPLTKTDWKGFVTKYTYNAQGLQQSRIEAFGTAHARTITTTWHGTFRTPTQIVEPGKTTDYTYDPTTGWMLTKTETDTTTHSVPYATNGQTRTWTYTYTAAGLVDTINGPRTDVTDVTDYDYDAAGNLTRITNALGQQTNITSYDLNGLPLTMTDANNVSTTMTYNERLWLKTSTTAGATTTFDYEPTGNIQKITLPNGAFLQYGYDNAQRLTSIENNIGERVEFTLDAMGNRTETRIKNNAAQIMYQHNQVFDALGRLYRDIGALNQTATFGYDKNDNNTSVQNPRLYSTTMAFDALNRLQTETNALSGITSRINNAQNLITNVTDPRNIATNYVYNGFGEAIYESTPDGGNITLYRNAGGNITQRIDGRGVITNFTFDALNRMLTETYPAASAENRTYIYDNATAGEYGKTRLWRMTDDSGSTTYVYDARGNIVKNTHVIQGTSYLTRYEYNLADQLTKIIYPSGRVVNYVRDAMGRVISVTTQITSVSGAVNLATSISYTPFGEVSGFTYGNGLTAQINYDTDYRISKIRVRDGAADLYHTDYGYDANGNINAITDNVVGARTQSFTYDELDRLTVASSGTGGNGAYGVESYGYDAASNRTSKVTLAGTETYNYASTSNRLNNIVKNAITQRSFIYDNAGNVISDTPINGDILGLDYNNAGRYVQLNKNTIANTLYKYNAMGERVIKYYEPQWIDAMALTEAFPILAPVIAALPADQQDDVMIEFGGAQAAASNYAVMPIPAIAGMTHYHYDLDHNLIAESLSNGKAMREYIYLPTNLAVIADNIDMSAASALPIAHLNNIGSTNSTNELLFIINDHLRTPTKLTTTAKSVVWDRFQTPFGENAALTGTKETNIRLPGQYFDFESNYHYNLMRDYDAKTGRYLQSDPIGLAGGLNRYGYVGGNPVNFVDPTGENPAASLIMRQTILMALPAAIANQMSKPPMKPGGAITPTSGKSASAQGREIASQYAICPDPNQLPPDCFEEWVYALQKCNEIWDNPNYVPRASNIGGKNFPQCVRGMVSESCGGNPTN